VTGSNAFSALMQGARQAARVLHCTLLPAKGELGWRVSWATSNPGAEAGWSEELTLRFGAGAASARVRLHAPPLSQTRPPPPPLLLPGAAASAPISPLLSLLKSALQKSVRRGLVAEAVALAAALLSVADEHGQRVGEGELLRRLPIIFVEDVPARPPGTF